MGTRPRLSHRRRLEILEAAMDVIADRGLCETRVADVARRAGTSAALILYYFESKDRLLTEALTHAEDRFYLETFHDLTGIEHVRERLISLIDRSFPGPDDTTGDWKLWMELWSRALRDAEAAKKRAALDRRWRNTIAEVVQEGQNAGEFDDEVDAEEFAVRLASLIDGLSIQAVLNDPEGSPPKLRRHCVEMASRELGFEVPEAAAGAAGVPAARRR
jgi:AcrR family transcriptional regulator